MKMTKFFKQFKLSIPDLLGVDAAAEEARNEIALRSASFKTVPKTAAEATALGEVARDIQTYTKQVRDFGLAARRPVNDFVALVKRTEDDHLAPLIAEKERIGPLLTRWHENEQKRVEAEERAAQAERDRLAALQAEQERKAQEAAAKAAATGKLADERKAEKLSLTAAATEEKLETALRAPEAVAVKPAGVAVKKVLRWEVTDINQLVKARPELCNIAPKASAIQAVCVPEMPVPGLRLWWENQAVVSRR